MKRIIMLVVLALVMAAMMLAMAVPAFAQEGLGPSTCQEEQPGQVISFVARNFGHSGTHNPGNADNPFPPFVPFGVGCNPHAT